MTDPVRLFLLTPNEPLYEHDPPPAGSPHARAFVNFRNIHLLAFGGAGNTTPSLKTLADENWIYFSSTAAAPADEDDDCIQNWEHSALMEISMQVMGILPGRQILLRVRLTPLGEHGRVRIAVGRSVVETQEIPHKRETTISLLLPAPPVREWMYIDIKHICSDDGEASAFKVYEIAGFLV